MNDIQYLPPATLGPQAVVRDSTYYLADGDCTLRVENTLFKVHRTVLSEDSSVFGGMFELPSEEIADMDGSSDDNPIVLIGDTVAEFKHFLWLLYSRSRREYLTASEGGVVYLEPLLDAARLANKYSFAEALTWALSKITNRIMLPLHRLDDVFSAKLYEYDAVRDRVEMTHAAHQIREIMVLAQENGFTPLFEFMSWRIERHGSPFVWLCAELSDELGVGELRGEAYLALLRRGAPFSVCKGGREINALEQEERCFRAALTSAQRMRLLTGFHRLVRTWDELWHEPPEYTHCAHCSSSSSAKDCRTAWWKWWRRTANLESVQDVHVADLHGRLNVIYRELIQDYNTSNSGMPSNCKVAALEATNKLRMKVARDLDDWFAIDVKHIGS